MGFCSMGEARGKFVRFPELVGPTDKFPNELTAPEATAWSGFAELDFEPRVDEGEVIVRNQTELGALAQRLGISWCPPELNMAAEQLLFGLSNLNGGAHQWDEHLLTNNPEMIKFYSGLGSTEASKNISSAAAFKVRFAEKAEAFLSILIPNSNHEATRPTGGFTKQAVAIEQNAQSIADNLESLGWSIALTEENGVLDSLKPSQDAAERLKPIDIAEVFNLRGDPSLFPFSFKDCVQVLQSSPKCLAFFRSNSQIVNDLNPGWPWTEAQSFRSLLL